MISRDSRHETPPVLKTRIIPCLDVKDGRVVKGVRFETLEKICEALQCQPGDLLEFRPGA